MNDAEINRESGRGHYSFVRDHNPYTAIRHGFLNYIVRTGDALSQLINVVIFLSENPNESLSGRSYRMMTHPFWGKMYALINLLFFWQDNHCRLAYEADLQRARDLLGL